MSYLAVSCVFSFGFVLGAAWRKAFEQRECEQLDITAAIERSRRSR